MKRFSNRNMYVWQTTCYSYNHLNIYRFTDILHKDFAKSKGLSIEKREREKIILIKEVP